MIFRSIAEAMKPVFENLATEIHSMMSKVRQEQKNTLQFMSEQFLENMKASGENMFKGMLDRTEELCEAQTRSNAEIGAILDKLGREKKDVSKIHMENLQLLGEVKDLQETCVRQSEVLTQMQNSVVKIESNFDQRSEERRVGKEC